MKKGIWDKGDGKRGVRGSVAANVLQKREKSEISSERMKTETNRTIFVSLCITTSSDYCEIKPTIHRIGCGSIAIL